jgi:CRISPR-associated endoribonuclease Cas6
MPLSALVHLEALEEAVLDQFTGRGVHGFWFQRWAETDPQIGDELHPKQNPPDSDDQANGTDPSSEERKEDVPPFALSPLLGLPRPQRGGIRIKPGMGAYFRLTALTDDLAEAVREKWLAGLDGERIVRIPAKTESEAGIAWKVTQVEVEAQAEYADLYARHIMNTNPPRQWNMKFETPTTFHGKEAHLPFPLPDALMRSWLRRWNAFAPVALPIDELLEWSRNHLAVSSYKLQTVPAREGKRLRMGCTGWLSLRALQMPPYLRAAADLLAHYAFYCGSGSHTTQGMGVTLLAD